MNEISKERMNETSQKALVELGTQNIQGVFAKLKNIEYFIEKIGETLDMVIQDDEGKYKDTDDLSPREIHIIDDIDDNLIEIKSILFGIKMDAENSIYFLNKVPFLIIK